jgi:hypothetical protein
MFRNVFCLLAIVVTLGLANAPAEGAFTVTLQEFNATTNANIGLAQVISDQGAGDIYAAGDQANVIGFGGSFGSFVLESLTAFSNAPGSPGEAILSSISFTARNTVAGPRGLRITVRDDGFTLPGVAGSETQLLNKLSSTHISTGGSATLASALDSDWTSAVTLTQPGYAGSDIWTVRGGPTFQLMSVLSVIVPAAVGPNQYNPRDWSAVNATGTTVAVLPEPASLAVWGLGIGVMALAGARRRAKTAKKA